MLRVEFNKQEQYVSQLKQAVLQEAIALFDWLLLSLENYFDGSITF